MADAPAPDAFRGRSVVSADDLSKDDLLYLLDAARAFDGDASRRDVERLLAGRILGLLFFEPSTRTRLSFESAMLRLGGSVLGFADAKMSSSSKGESLADTIRVVASYCDAIVLRHPMEGAARLAADVAGIPVVNGGDGSNQHPTQTFLDLYTIRKATGRLDGLKVAFMGDLRYGRTVHSLARALLHFDGEFVFVGPAGLRLPEELREALRQAGRLGQEVETLDAVRGADVLYVTRIQKERFPDPLDYEKVRNAYRVDRASIARFGPNLKVLHPLPRVNEVDEDVDDLPGALYFQQVRNGVTVRMALLHLLLGDAREAPVTRPNDFRLEHGTVIDHLPVGTAVRALELLGIPRSGGAVTVGINVPSKRSGRKDIVRVEGLELQKHELDRLALLGRGVTVSIVKDGDVAGKVHLEVPKRLDGLLRCPNPTCITNAEHIATRFERTGEFPYRFKCVYCERITGATSA